MDRRMVMTGSARTGSSARTAAATSSCGPSACAVAARGAARSVLGVASLARRARRSSNKGVLVARSGPKGVEDLANFDDDGVEIKDEGAPTSDWKGQFFGTYLQLGVWVSVLSFAGYTGYTKILESADAAQDVGLLVAPSTAAIFLIVSFMTYTFVIQKKASEE